MDESYGQDLEGAVGPREPVSGGDECRTANRQTIADITASYTAAIWKCA